MRRFFRSTGFKLFLIVAAALLAGTVFAAVSHNNSAPATSATSTVFGPLQRLSSFISDGLSGFSFNFKSAASIAEEKRELEDEIARLREQLVDFEQSKQKNKLYEEFLDIKLENPDYQFVSAAVIGRDPAELFGSFTLNRGTLHGVSVNDPVLYGRYLVGVVVSVMPAHCKVHTLLSAYEVRTREPGFVTTTVELSGRGLCRMPGLVRTTAVSPGGIVSTSGIGGLFPRDLIIGTVTEVADDEADISSYAVIRPGVQADTLEDVFILVAFEGRQAQTEAGE
jgi:rod shape-determining protein MreC